MTQSQSPRDLTYLIRQLRNRARELEGALRVRRLVMSRSSLKLRTALTPAEVSTLEDLRRVAYCLRAKMRRELLRRRLVRTIAKTCDEHRHQRFVEITEKGLRALRAVYARRA